MEKYGVKLNSKLITFKSLFGESISPNVNLCCLYQWAVPLIIKLTIKEELSMFHENLKTIRKAKGLSQEELATRLHVVRQTISKWEKALSVPDAEMLIRIAEVFEVTVSELLGAKIPKEEEINSIAEQLSRINEQLAIKNRRAKFIWKVILGIILSIIIFNLLIVVLSVYLSVRPSQNDKNIEEKTQTENIMIGE